MKSAFMKGLVDSPAGFRFSCSSGNCTWPDFSALGFCTSCNDATTGTTEVLDTVSLFNASTDIAVDGDPDDCLDLLYTTPAGVTLRMSKGCSYAYRDHWSPGCESRTTLQNRNPESLRLPFPTPRPYSTSDFLSTTSRSSIETARATQISTSATRATLFNRAPSAKLC